MLKLDVYVKWYYKFVCKNKDFLLIIRELFVLSQTIQTNLRKQDKNKQYSKPKIMRNLFTASVFALLFIGLPANAQKRSLAEAAKVATVFSMQKRWTPCR